MTITVTYTNGNQSTFQGCSGVTITSSLLSFKGRKVGDTADRLWTIVLANVTEFSQQS